MPKLAAIFQERYCKNHFSNCARYLVASILGGQQVPELMFPTQNEWAEQIIKDYEEKQKPFRKSQISSSS